MAKRLVLHAGVHKTGSTYIQGVMFNNRDALRRSGIAVPRTLEHDPASLRTFAFSFHKPEFQDQFRRLVLEEPEDTVLVSSEELSHAIRDHHLTREFLRDLSASHGVQVQIVAYLRRQDELRESTFQQQARGAYCGSIHEFEGYPFDYRPTIAAFREAADIVTLRPYERAAWRRGDVFFDLMHAAGLSLCAPILTPPGRINASFDRRLVLYLSAVPRERKFGCFEQVCRLSELGTIQPDGMRFLTPPRDRLGFLERFAEANLEIAADDADLRDHLVCPVVSLDWTPPEPITPAERAAADVILAGGDEGEAEAAAAALRPAKMTRRVLRRLARLSRATRSGAPAKAETERAR